MSLNKDYYVYVYCDPRKKGNYSYMENGVGIDFEYEPFYIGMGKGNRVKIHLSEAKDNNFEKKKGNNKYKIRKIRKIWSENKEPIIYKIVEKLNQYDAKLIEKFLITLIGRYDLCNGILTNLTGGGDGLINISDYIKKKKKKTRKLTLKKNPEILENMKKNRKKTIKENPEIMKKSCDKRLQTLKENPEIMKKHTKKRLQTLKNNPSIAEESTKKRLQTLKENPSITLKAQNKRSQTLRNNPEIMKNAGKKQSQTLKENPHIKIESGKKSSKTKIINKISWGKNNKHYISFDPNIAIPLYFSCIGKIKMVQKYCDITKIKISPRVFGRFYKILDFPVNTISIHNPDNKKIYLKFVEENKDKQQFFIDNYERLEDEYWDKLWKEKYGDFYKNI